MKGYFETEISYIHSNNRLTFALPRTIVSPFWPRIELGRSERKAHASSVGGNNSNDNNAARRGSPANDLHDSRPDVAHHSRWKSRHCGHSVHAAMPNRPARQRSGSFGRGKVGLEIFRWSRAADRRRKSPSKQEQTSLQSV